MPFQNIFKMFKPDTPVRNVCNIDDMNFIRNVFNDIQGINCRIDKPQHMTGLGWRIIVGDGSDVERPDNISDPFTATGGETLNFPFKVTTDGSTAECTAGTVYILNQSASVAADKTGMTGAKVYVTVPISGSWSNGVGTPTISSAASVPASTSSNYYYHIADVDYTGDGTVTQRIFGDIYDRNIPIGGSDYDVVMVAPTTATGGGALKPTVESLRAQ